MLSPLDSNLSLSTNSSSGAGGDFRVYAHTSNAPLDVSISVSPADSHLVFEGSTKNAPARVALPAASHRNSCRPQSSNSSERQPYQGAGNAHCFPKM